MRSAVVAIGSSHVARRSAHLNAPCEITRMSCLQVALLQKENKSVSGHLKAAQSARAAAQRAASQLREENTALAEGRDRATVRLHARSADTWAPQAVQRAGGQNRDLMARLCAWPCESLSVQPEASCLCCTELVREQAGASAADHAECEARLAAALREASRLQSELAASERAKRGLEVGVREVEDALTRTEQRVRHLQAARTAEPVVTMSSSAPAETRLPVCEQVQRCVSGTLWLQMQTLTLRCSESSILPHYLEL